MAKRKSPPNSHSNQIQQLKKLVSEARSRNELKELNEYLRLLIMGPYGDTKYDKDFIEKMTKKQLKWRKKSLNKIN